MQYIATFYTHLSAILTDRNLKERGIVSALSPVPRKLSSSCGTCVRFTAEEPSIDAMDVDCEGVYRDIGNGKFERITELP